MASRDHRYRNARLTPKSSKRATGAKKNGFSQLDPAQMGLDMPDWLDDAAGAAVDDERPASDSESRPTPEATPRTLLEGMKIVCICKGIKTRTFWRAMDEGAQTHAQIDAATGSGSGQCQGRRCGPRILEMLRKTSR